MEIIIFSLLLIIGPSVIIAAKTPPLTENDVFQIIHDGSSIVPSSSGHVLTLTDGGKLGENDNVIVWAGKFDGQTVAVKIVWDEGNMYDEIAVYEALGALEDNSIEEHGVPRIYYHGPVLSNYYAIVMSLFDGTLEDRYMTENEQLSSMSILLIFKRLIEILKYFHSKNVVHNDIKPENIFIRGNQVFIGDFDVATLNGDQNDYGTEFFASRNYWADRNRGPMDDLESLLYTMWSVAGIPMGGPSGRYPEGKALAQYMRDRVEKAYMKEKLKGVKDKDLKAAFDFVANEVISWGENPFYDDIIGQMNESIQKIHAKTGQTGFEWLGRRSSASASHSGSLSRQFSQMRLSRGNSMNKSTRSSSPRLTKNVSTRSSGSVKSRRPSFNRAGSFKPVNTNRFAESRSYSRIEYQPDDSQSPNDSPECGGCFNIIPSCGKHKK